MKRPRFSGEWFPERTLIGRIYRTDELEQGVDPLLSIELDGVDEHWLEDQDDPDSYLSLLLERDELKPFALLRFEVTTKQFEKEAQIAPAPGSWFAITLSRSPGVLGWPVDHAQLTEGGYTQGSSGFIDNIELWLMMEIFRRGRWAPASRAVAGFARLRSMGEFSRLQRSLAAWGGAPCGSILLLTMPLCETLVRRALYPCKTEGVPVSRITTLVGPSHSTDTRLPLQGRSGWAPRQ